MAAHDEDTVDIALEEATGVASVTVTLDFLSAFVSKGIVGNDEAVFQPNIFVAGPWGFAFNIWGNMNLTDTDSYWYPDTQGKWSEFDLDLSWTTPWDSPVLFSIGATYFTFPQEGSYADEEGNMVEAPADGNYEIWMQILGNFIANPALKYCHDLRNSDDWYVLASVSHSFAITDPLSLNLGATVGFGGSYFTETNYGGDGSGFTHAQFDAILNYAVTEALSVGVRGSYTTLIDEDVRDGCKANEGISDVDLFFGGVTVNFTF